MKHEHPPKGEVPATDLVAEAEAQLWRIGRRLGEITERLDAGDLGAAGEVPAAVAALDKALGAVFSERARRERHGGGTGGEGGGGLDLEAARDEIRRRLDRLRTHGGAGELPEGAG